MKNMFIITVNRFRQLVEYWNGAYMHALFFGLFLSTFRSSHCFTCRDHLNIVRKSFLYFMFGISNMPLKPIKGSLLTLIMLSGLVVTAGEYPRGLLIPSLGRVASTDIEPIFNGDPGMGLLWANSRPVPECAFLVYEENGTCSRFSINRAINGTGFEAAVDVVDRRDSNNIVWRRSYFLLDDDLVRSLRTLTLDLILTAEFPDIKTLSEEISISHSQIHLSALANDIMMISAWFPMDSNDRHLRKDIGNCFMKIIDIVRRVERGMAIGGSDSREILDLIDGLRRKIEENV